MKILANIGQEMYFQISGVNGVFAGLWVGKAIFWATPIHLATRNQPEATWGKSVVIRLLSLKIHVANWDSHFGSICTVEMNTKINFLLSLEL